MKGMNPVHEGNAIAGRVKESRRNGMFTDFVPGAFVIHPGEPEWGIGQVQSAVGVRVTVNFENAGKRTINTGVVDLRVVTEDEAVLPHH